jgi:hypothetical protein
MVLIKETSNFFSIEHPFFSSRKTGVFLYIVSRNKETYDFNGLDNGIPVHKLDAKYPMNGDEQEDYPEPMPKF